MKNPAVRRRRHRHSRRLLLSRAPRGKQKGSLRPPPHAHLADGKNQHTAKGEMVNGAKKKRRIERQYQRKYACKQRRPFCLQSTHEGDKGKRYARVEICTKV